jgi:hypothetical protein
MNKLLSGVKRVLLSVLSNRGSGSCSGDNQSQDSPRSLSFVPSPQETAGLSRYLAQAGVPMAMDGVDISIHSIEEMGKYESLCQREFDHTHVYNVNMLERVGMDEELPLILWAIGW